MDSMFLGEFEHAVDPKNRVSVPKKFRSKLKGAVLTRGLDGCLFLYPQDNWVKLTDKLNNLPLTQKDARSFNRYLLASAVEVEFDSLGRVLIPGYLRDYAQIKTVVIIVGVGDRVEVWEKSNWKKYQELTEKNSEEIAEKLSGSGL